MRNSGLLLAGGWGYNNLGDEAILAGYLAELSAGRHIDVLSPDRLRTETAQLPVGDFSVTREGSRVLSQGTEVPMLLGGGGYLNGHWQPELTFKLRRLLRSRGERRLIAHGIEVRNLGSRSTARLASRLFDAAAIAVRDERSAEELVRLGSPEPVVLPDAISLMYPHTRKYINTRSDLSGAVILNLLDISERPDRAEAEVDAGQWRDFCVSLIERLGGRAVGMVIGGGDYRFLKSLPPMPIFEPRSAADLLSSIASAEAILSVRMHPALIGSMLGQPTVSIPYCGKVRPTLERIGVEGMILGKLDVNGTIEQLGCPRRDATAWRKAFDRNASWISEKLADVR